MDSASIVALDVALNVKLSVVTVTMELSIYA